MLKQAMHYTLAYLVRAPWTGCTHACDVRVRNTKHYMAFYNACPRDCGAHNVTDIYWSTQKYD